LFLITFAAAPDIFSGEIAELTHFNPLPAATFVLVDLVYPFFVGLGAIRSFRPDGGETSEGRMFRNETSGTSRSHDLR
jgi:hypothetical protein